MRVIEEISAQELGRRITGLRGYRRMGLTELSALTGVSVTSLSRYERGTRWPPVNSLMRIAAALGTTVGDLTSRVWYKARPHGLAA